MRKIWLLFLMIYLCCSSSRLKAAEEVISISIDGGGIRGVYAAKFLSRLEGDLQREVNSRVYISECLNVLAGTSTGGLIACGLNIPNKEGTSPKYHAQDLYSIYINHGKKIFERSWIGNFSDRFTKSKTLFGSRYDRKNLERVVEEQVLEETLLKDLNIFCEIKFSDPFSEKLIVPAYNVNTASQQIFNTSDNNTASEYKMKDVVFATSAAPYYFDAYDKDGTPFLDGGLIANNPSLYALKESYKERGKAVYLLSIGTGYKVNDYCSLLNRGGIGAAFNIAEFISLIMEGTSRNTDEILSDIYSKKIIPHFTYISANSQLHDNSFDKTDPRHLSMLSDYADQQYDKMQNELNTIRSCLIKFCNEGLLKKRIDRCIRKNGGEIIDLSGVPALSIVKNIGMINFNMLKKLYLSGINFNDNIGINFNNCLDSIKQINTLQFLSLSQNNIGNVLRHNVNFEEKILNFLDQFRNIKTLILSVNELTERNYTFIENIKLWISAY